MPLSIGVNLRVTGHCNQGRRKYMEDMFSVAYQQTSDDKDLEYAFFGIFDGHGGGEAATFAKEHLMDIIVKQKNFWSDKDEDVLRAIRDGYVNTHYAMWRELDKWPRTASGLPSTAGTTASIAFIRKGKIYIGHVGDSGIVLGYQEDDDPRWKAKALTKDHKPESGPEMTRIQESGGKVVSKSGVPRVVWNRPRIGHKGPVRRSTHIDEIPFLAVARSLGDLWSYNSELDTFVVSPEPDVKVLAVDVKSHRCLIFGTDGLWNVLTPKAAVSIVQAAERHNEKHLIASQQTGHRADVQMWINPSKSLVDQALERWFLIGSRADNTSVVTLMLDPPGPSRSEVFLSQKKEHVPVSKGAVRPVLVPAETAEKPFPCVNDETKRPDASSVPVPDDATTTTTTAVQVAEISSSDTCVISVDRAADVGMTTSENVPTAGSAKQRDDGVQRVVVSKSLSVGKDREESHVVVKATDGALSRCRDELRSGVITSETRRSSHGSLSQADGSFGVEARSRGAKRRHSSVTVQQAISSGPADFADSRLGGLGSEQEARADPSDPNDPNDPNDPDHSRLRWPAPEPGTSSAVAAQERRSSPNSFQRRSLEKKATPVKTIRRPSINGSSRIQLRANFGLGRDWDSPSQRWLRSDTIAATPIKTLRSRNVDITGHTVSAQLASRYGTIGQSRLSLPAKSKRSMSTGKRVKQSNGSGSGSGSVAVAKRAKSPYNPSARSLGTRSRIKRLGK